MRGMPRIRGRGVPLRVGLVAATLVLVACGLLASGIAVTSILQHSLINRVDQTLLDASRGWAQAPRRMPPPPLEGPNPARPPSNFYVRGIGPDGHVWFAEANGNKIGRLTPQGALAEWATPTDQSEPFFLAVGADGNIWFTEVSANKIGRITP